MLAVRVSALDAEPPEAERLPCAEDKVMVRLWVVAAASATLMPNSGCATPAVAAMPPLLVTVAMFECRTTVASPAASKLAAGSSPAGMLEKIV